MLARHASELAAHDLESDLDNGPRTGKSGTERMCVVTRSVRPIDELIRFVLAPSGEAIPDLKRKLPGRGLWVTSSHKAVAEAAKRNLFAKGFKKNVKPSATLADDTDRLMVRGIIEALAMSAKSRQVVAGFSKVEDALRQRQAGVLIHASNGASDGIRKLDGVARQSAGDDAADAPLLPIVTILTSDELDLALGRSNVIHAALLAGPASKTFLSRSQTLVRYRMADDGKAGVGVRTAGDTNSGKTPDSAGKKLVTKQLVTEPLAMDDPTESSSAGTHIE